MNRFLGLGKKHVSMISDNKEEKLRNYILRIKWKTGFAHAITDMQRNSYLRREDGLKMPSSSVIASDTIKLEIIFNKTTNACDGHK